MMYDFLTVDSKIMHTMRSRLSPTAPWATWSDAAWKFLEDSTGVGLVWKVHQSVLDAHLAPTTKAQTLAQQKAQYLLDALGEVVTFFPSGIGLMVEQELGVSRTNDEGDDVFSPTNPTPSKDVLLEKIFASFWTDVSALTWYQAREHLVRRTEHCVRNGWGERTQTHQAIDHVDFGRVFRLLEFSQKLVATPALDVSKIIDPPKPLAKQTKKPTK